MRLEEALRLLTRIHDRGFVAPYQNQKEALRLGIEALKRVKHVRETYQKTSYVMLPGETKE